MKKELLDEIERSSKGMVFEFSRNQASEFQSRLECIRNENSVRSAFVVRYIFDNDKAVAVVPRAAVRSFTDEQVKRLKDV